MKKHWTDILFSKSILLKTVDHHLGGNLGWIESMVQQVLTFEVLKGEIPTLLVGGIKGEDDSLQLGLCQFKIFVFKSAYQVKD